MFVIYFLLTLFLHNISFVFGHFTDSHFTDTENLVDGVDNAGQSVGEMACRWNGCRWNVQIHDKLISLPKSTQLLSCLRRLLHFILEDKFIFPIFSGRNIYSTALSLEFAENSLQYIFWVFSGRSIYSTALSLEFCENQNQFIFCPSDCNTYSTAPSCILAQSVSVSSLSSFFNFYDLVVRGLCCS